MTLSICKPPISLLVTLHFMHSMNHLNGLGGVQNLLKSYFAQIYASISRSPNCPRGIPFAQTKLLSLVFPYCLIKIIRKRLLRAHLLLVLVSSPLLKDNESGQKMCLDNILFIKSHLYNLILIQLSHIIMIRTLFESFSSYGAPPQTHVKQAQESFLFPCRTYAHQVHVLPMWDSLLVFLYIEGLNVVD